MKFASKIVLALGIVCFLMMYEGCKKHKDEPVPFTDQQLDLLNKAVWKVTAVTLGGVDKMSDYANFQLTLSGTKGQATFNFTTSGRPALSPWPSSGQFTFVTGSTTDLSRNDTPPVIVQYAVTATNLNMSFSFAGSGYTNRTANVTGDWIFTFGH
jgi:hypothetical protein